MGRPDQAIFLISTVIPRDENGHPATDENGIQVIIEEERRVFAEELAVFSNEFYNAAVAGLRPEKMFEMYTREYQGETKLRHGNTTYRIIRTSLGKTKEKTRLVCERVAADG